jgi:hypothetical protein
MGLVIFGLICLAPAVCFKLFIEAAAAINRYSGSRDRTPPRDLVAERERCCRDLRRLATAHDRLLAGNEPAKAARLRAIELAYDDTLRTACGLMKLDEPPARLGSGDRLQIEASLAASGLVW